MQIVNKNVSYDLKVSFGALKRLDEMEKEKTGNSGTGLVTKYIELKEGGDPEALRDIIFALNANNTPRLELSDVEEYLETLEDTKIEKLSEQVCDFLLNTGLSGMRIRKIMARMPKEPKK